MEPGKPFIHPYIPNSVPAVRDAMLRAVGAASTEDFFADIPAALRMQAPLIRFGASLPSSAPRAVARTPLAVPPAILDQTAERWLVGGSLNVPPASFHHTSLVTRKHLTIGAGSHIAAGIKSNGDLRLEGDLRIDGAVVCSGTLYIGPGCIIKGPVVCEKTVTIAAGTVIGSLALPTTVTAPEMRIEEGVLAHGSVWAREIGFVAPPRARRA